MAGKKGMINRTKKTTKPIEDKIELNIISHPPTLFAYQHNHIDLILNILNRTNKTLWFEAEIYLSDKISLNPAQMISKGRMRIGILKPKEKIEKNVKVYANTYTNPNLYPVRIVLFCYDKEAVIYKRIEQIVDVRCEIKKKPVL